MGSNLMGKFTQSVRRIAQDFQDQGTPGGQTKEEAMKTQLRLRHTRRRLEESYETAKRALVNLHNEYEKSKELSFLSRYALLKSIIKDIATPDAYGQRKTGFYYIHTHDSRETRAPLEAASSGKKPYKSLQDEYYEGEKRGVSTKEVSRKDELWGKDDKASKVVEKSLRECSKVFRASATPYDEQHDKIGTKLSKGVRPDDETRKSIGLKGKEYDFKLDEDVLTKKCKQLKISKDEGKANVMPKKDAVKTDSPELIKQTQEIEKQVVRLETQYWTLLDVPKQEKQEPVGTYVLRACVALEKVQIKPSEKASVLENEERTREEKERLEDMTSTQIEAENTQLINDLYRLLKRYAGLRLLIKELTTEYSSAKYYPIIPRYMLLKDMVKTVTHNPDYMEVCHEVCKTTV